jgi:ribosomal protein S18 acetylase RimI-like enzyme
MRETGIMLREAITADASAIRCLMQRVPGFWQTWWSDQTIRVAVESAKGLALVWESDSQIVGFICAHDLGFRAYLSELIVDPGMQQHGIGTRLVIAVEDILRTRKQQTIIADVWLEATQFYQSLGWSAPDAMLLRHRLNSAL